MNKPRLSIIVPVYNVEKYIHAAVDSILNQTFTDFELILIDDGSTDSSGSICDEYAGKDSRVKVIHQNHEGVSDVRNKGISLAQGELIGFADSDDTMEKTMYREMIRHLDDNNLDIVCTDAFVIRNGIKTFRPRYQNDMIFNHGRAVNEILNGTLDNAVWNKVYRRKVIGNIQFPKGRVYEDVATVYKFVNNAERVGYLCKPLYHYIKRKGSITNTSFNSKGRYDCFCGYKERAEFAEQQQLACRHRCVVLALETALSALTAFYAVNESVASDKYQDVTSFIKNHAHPDYVRQLNSKHRVLMYCFQHCIPAYKIYAIISAKWKELLGER